MEDANQNRSDWYWYSAYGSTWTYRQGVFTPHQFVGKAGYYDDGDSGMLLLGHRYYLPGLQRFLTQDPKGHAAGLNLYEYAEDNPLVHTDPTGLDAVIMWGRNNQDMPHRLFFRDLANIYAHNYESTGNPLSGSSVTSAIFGSSRAHVFHVENVADVQKALATPNIDTLIYVGHASAWALYLSDKELHPDGVAALRTDNILPGAHCYLLGCDTAGPNLRGGADMAEAFANHFGIPTAGSVGGLSFGLHLWGRDWEPGLLRSTYGMRTVEPPGVGK